MISLYTLVLALGAAVLATVAVMLAIYRILHRHEQTLSEINTRMMARMVESQDMAEEGRKRAQLSVVPKSTKRRGATEPYPFDR